MSDIKKIPKGVLIGGQKGGTGKSTISANLAIMFKIAGWDTMMVDADDQRSSLKFADRRSSRSFEPKLICTHLSGSNLQIPITDLSEKYNGIIIDCGGQDSTELRSAMISPCVDLMIIPISADYVDLETLEKMDNLAQISKMYNPNLIVKCLINKAPTNKLVTIVKEAEEFIKSDLKNLGLIETRICHRIAYPYAYAKGMSVVEYEKKPKSDNKATLEMMSLFKEITNEDFPIEKVKYRQEKVSE